MGIENDYEPGFRGLTQNDLPLLEKWYGMTDDFGYATGFKGFSDIRLRLMEPNKSNRLASMISIGPDNRTIGFVYGEMKTVEMKNVFWIHILIIEPAYQSRGYGTRAVNKLLQYVHKHYGPITCIAAVSRKNVQGLSFWEKAGFSHSIGLEESLHQFGPSDVAILKKVIK